MRTSYSLFSFPEQIDLQHILSLIHAAGYDAYEPILSDSGYLNMQTSDSDVLRMKEMSANMELGISSVGVWSLWNHNLVSHDPQIRARAEEIVRRQLEIASLFNADTILIVPGYVGCDFAAQPERIRYDIAYDRCVESLLRLSAHAESCHVNIGIENVWNRFLLSPLEMKRMIEEVNSPFVGAYFDVGNIIYTGYPEDWIFILGAHIKKIHLSDYRFSQSGLEAFVDLFAGDVDFDAVTDALVQIGYDNDLVVEMLPNYKQYPEISILSSRPAVEKICALMREKKMAFG